MTMKDSPRVLLVEDSAPLAAVYQEYLKDELLTLEHVADGESAMKSIQERLPDLVLLDLVLPDMTGQEILQWIGREKLPCSVVVMTAHGSVDVAVDVMQLGAEDFLEKPVSAGRLKTTVRNILEKHRLRYLVEDMENTFERKTYHDFIGSSLAMQGVYRIIDSAASSKASVFITGESGTGKEVCAEAIHKQGNRADKPFIALNCAAIPHDLMESEIFGHVKGAFTGAAGNRKGAASLADGGTLFLDELAEMDMDLQSKLLRFIQTGTFQKVGGTEYESVDVRFICATNRDPLQAVADGRLREDLYYRLHVVPVHLPPLRSRGDDILAIAMHFLLKYSQEEDKDFRGFSPEVEIILRNYNWPGNVRQLQNVIRNIVVLNNDTSVTLSHLPPPLNAPLNEMQFHRETGSSSSDRHDTASATSAQRHSPSVTADVRPLAIVEKEAIEHAIRVCGDNIPRAAALLEVSPSTIYRKKQAWDRE
jgi:DNA-binding NtrC family response regulator